MGRCRGVGSGSRASAWAASGARRSSGGHRERLDVPHHVAVVVVVVRPVGQPEERGAGQRRGMDRAEQVEDARIGDGLPAMVGSRRSRCGRARAPARRRGSPPQCRKAAFGTEGGESSGLLVRPRVRQAPERTRSGGWTGTAVRSAPGRRRSSRSGRARRACGVVRSASPDPGEGRRVGDAERARCRPGVPEQAPSTPSLGPWSCGWARRSPTTRHAGRIDASGQREVGRPIDRTVTSATARAGTVRGQNTTVSTEAVTPPDAESPATW